MKEIRRNITLLLVLMTLAFTGLAAYCVWTVREHGAAWRASAYNPRADRLRREAAAGAILDRSGAVLAARGKQDSRVYPEGFDAVCHVVGDPWGLCPTGAETVFAPLLLGLEETDGDKFLRLARGAAPEGLDVTLTVDIRLQRAALRAMGDYKGAAVALNYTTGEILCMVSRPGFDPLQTARLSGLPADPGAPLVNRALTGRYAPGSVFKIVTAAVALESGWDPESALACGGLLEISGDGIAYGGGEGHGTLNMYDAFARSCNAYFGTLGMSLGAEALREGARRLGFNRSFDFEEIRMAGSSFPLEGGASAADTARAAIGQHEDTVTPLHMALLAGAAANGGVMMEPRWLLAAGAGGADGNRFAPREWGRVMSAGTAWALDAMMRLCVSGGTGTAAALEGLTVAGKTGTAEVSDSGGAAPHGWFVGYIAGGGHPVCVAVILEHAGGGGRTAAPAAAEILAEAVRLGY